LLALRQSIVDAAVVPDICCQVTTEERFLKYVQGQYLIMLIPGAMKPEDQGGEGQSEVILNGTITFRLLAQSALDPATSDLIALTDNNSTTGIYVLFTKLLQVIRFWDQCDESGNTYLMQPMRMASGLTQPRRSDEHNQYVYMDTTAEFKICVAQGASGA
jgi:hypothetical protein